MSSLEDSFYTTSVVASCREKEGEALLFISIYYVDSVWATYVQLYLYCRCTVALQTASSN